VTRPKAVTFDYWQTLVSERRGDMREMAIASWTRALEDAGQPRSPDEIADAMVANWGVFEERWRTNTGQYGAVDSVDFVARRLGIEMIDGLRARLVDGYRIVGETAPLHPAPGVGECLRALRTAGVRLGIVCDVGLTGSPVLRKRLEGFGLLGYFDAWAFSDETGWFKPAPEAFWPALEGLGVTPDEAAHVGDNERTDIAGARALGMTAVQYTGLYEMAGWLTEQQPGALADHVIDDLTDLPDVLGVT
jgi:putative hydrolase of the HAD superfamily